MTKNACLSQHLTYAVPDIGKRIAKAKIGIVFIQYTGETLDEMTANFGYSVNGLKKHPMYGLMINYKDVSGIATLTGEEEVKLMLN